MSKVAVSNVVGAWTLIMAVLTSCSHHATSPVDLTISELGEAIATGEDVQLSSSASFEPNSPVNVNATLIAPSHEHQHWAGGGDPSVTSPDTHRYSIGYRQTTLSNGRSVNPIDGGWLAYTGRWDQRFIRLSVHGQGASFSSAQGSGFDAPVFLGAAMAGGGYWTFPTWALSAGLEVTTGMVGFEFDQPVSINNQRYEADNLGFVTVGVPVTAHWLFGPVALESRVQLNTSLFNDKTALGFGNDWQTLSLHWFWDLGLGYQW